MPIEFILIHDNQSGTDVFSWDLTADLPNCDDAPMVPITTIGNTTIQVPKPSDPSKSKQPPALNPPLLPGRNLVSLVLEDIEQLQLLPPSPPRATTRRRKAKPGDATKLEPWFLAATIPSFSISESSYPILNAQGYGAPIQSCKASSSGSSSSAGKGQPMYMTQSVLCQGGPSEHS
ncbi:hypothetical protein M413DRAFT_32802 [Hebeloma cylindrosporum]|uniref:Uncharacterized protein n=1 Tax=Hebeloma cylindrosporum TaxID=76867 RepID=A0A0C3BE34_HEBCY|nr:hypothetical protein M413DRAFT_32802 [Hebeloma cylindrosporum h7]